eukprot:TRINITY_DN10248_c0_g1_i1.p1 TRINITY_DN10248_c0_g1~~TRINITY_DN10248_c0_g1_i1.p1  ORF type:complete len:128 (-),score=38.30 TRINITY_DN10248_c0_g1_i1:71-454(-)
MYRPPLARLSIEFPAGLIDAGEDPETAGLRELKEETGYVGKVIKVGPVFSYEPGLSNACARMVHMEIDGSLTENIDPQPELEDDEFIEVFTVGKDNFLEEVIAMAESKGAVIEGKVYATGWALSMIQ